MELVIQLVLLFYMGVKLEVSP